MQECGIAVTDANVHEVITVLFAGTSQCNLKPGKRVLTLVQTDLLFSFEFM